MSTTLLVTKNERIHITSVARIAYYCGRPAFIIDRRDEDALSGGRGALRATIQSRLNRMDGGCSDSLAFVGDAIYGLFREDPDDGWLWGNLVTVNAGVSQEQYVSNSQPRDRGFCVHGLFDGKGCANCKRRHHSFGQWG